ncbi:MAG: lytic murein transglycosylase B [Gammaproteobacteria bacterium]|nr:lytic murein transglycosylase B [Gammaproteobacteria bacterium]
MKRLLALGLSLFMAADAAAATLRPQDLARMQELSQQTGVPMSQISRATAQADFRQAVLDAYKRPAESKPWYEYEALFLTEKRVNQGVNFWRTHAADLARAERTFNVPASVIVAIIGVETFYGGNMGTHPVLDSLYTLAFYHPTRTEFFSKEFVNYIRLGNQQSWDLKTRQGSYAGAMGMGQFMPSSYLTYAVDFDGDGHKDLFSNPTDAIGSVANYFHKHGWKMGDAVVEAAQLTRPSAAGKVQDRVELKQRWQELQNAGVRVKTPLQADTPVTLLQYAQPDYSEYWVARQNFYVITRYNRSPLYAMAVHNLSQQIAKQYYGR